jgi:hypothetical protein
MKSPTGRINRPWYPTVQGHVASIVGMDFAHLELQAMSHELDEYQTWARTKGVDYERSKQILEEEILNAAKSRESAFELARRRILKSQT